MIKKRLSHRWKMPQDSAREKVSHGETAITAGYDADPCLLVNLDAVGVEFGGQKRARNSRPLSHPVSAYFNGPAAFDLQLVRPEISLVREKIDTRNGTGATYKGPSNSSLPPKAYPYSGSQTVHPLGLFQVIHTHDRGLRRERSLIGVQ
jgi:hypothetical protein